MSSAAQNEFNDLVNSNRAHFSSHPEDRVQDSASASASDSEDHDHDHDQDPNLDQDPTMNSSSTSSYTVPRTVFDANTGPKGVIADAQAFERARKSSFRNTLKGSSRASNNNDDAMLLHRRDGSEHNKNKSEDDEGGDDDEEQRFLRQWRESRMQELRSQNGRKPSPRRRVYGAVDTVDAVGYLDAVEKVPGDTVVVVCIYDPETSESSIVEDCLDSIARRQRTVHFVKLHHEIAEMDHITPPALLAYRGGDVFATIVDIHGQIRGQTCSPDKLEDLLKMHRVL